MQRLTVIALLGLSWLGIRHVQMGLMRHRTVVRHLRIMSEIAKSSHAFALRAGRHIFIGDFYMSYLILYEQTKLTVCCYRYCSGSWGLDPYVGEPEIAVNNLRDAVYGKASNDSNASG
jgi:hypothetical protein